MLRLHLSLAAARSAAGNASMPGTAENLPGAPGDPPPARVNPTSDRLSTNGGGQPRLRRGSRSGEPAGECVRNGGEGLVPRAKSEADSMVKKEQSRSCAVAAETQADESDHSGYDTAAGYSDFYESFGECADSPPSNGDAGAGDLRPSLRAQVGREEPALCSERGASSSSSVLLWDRSPCEDDEAHYITTHEIQLYELDNDGERELDAGWDAEESSASYSCRDSSSLGSDASEGNSRTPLGISYAGDPPPAVCTAINPLENLPENGNSGGQPQLSSEGSSAQEPRNPPTANSQGSGNQGDMTKLAGDVCKDAKSRRNIPLCAVAKYKWKAFGNSSGTSSAVSELDDADKEVRSLTARTFRSLACAGDEYLDTFSVGCRTSTDLSADETVALNRCATYIDLKCHNTTGKSGQIGFPTKSGKSGAGQGAESTQKRQQLPVDKQTAKRQLHLSGKFEQSGSRVITLTETLNFRYDIREQLSARREGERRAQLARGAVGSRCTDEVTEPREEGGENCSEIGRTAEAMDGVQKKSKFASNLLQNVIWKKMQFEQELKMERGEISDTTFAAAPTSPPAAATTTTTTTDSPKGRDVLEPNCNRLSGGSPDTSPLPGEAAPCQTLPASSNARAAAAGEPPSDGCKGTLPRSQRSAFRSWKDNVNEPPQTDSKRAQRVRADIGGHPLCKETKMSQLFVPGIQKAPGKKKHAQEEREGGARAPSKPNDRTATIQGERAASKPGVPATSCSPEIQIRLQGGLPSPFSIAKLLTPNISGGPGKGAAGEGSGGPGAGGRARAPPFAVRDVRDNMQRLQAPIHQVRDVRKLVKSSYHVLTVEGGPRPGPGVEQPGGGGSVQPIVIKCQAVSRKEARPGEERVSALAQRASGRSPARVPGNEAEQRGNRLALEKLTAAVKTMEQLYVFDNHEWRRRSDASAEAAATTAAARSGPSPGLGPLAGSRLLSLIASEEASGGSARVAGGGDGRQLQEAGEGRAVPARESARAGARLLPPGPAHVHALLPPRAPPAHKPPAAAGGAAPAAPPLFAVAPQPSAIVPAIRTTPAAAAVGGGRRSPQQPPPPPPDLRPFRSQTEESNEKQAAAATAGWQQKPPPAPAPPPPFEHENYLTIPVKRLPAAPRDPTPPVVYQHQQAQLIRLTPPAMDPFSPGRVQPVPPVMVDSPSVPCSPMPFYPVPHTQRRMLMDPATGQCYLVDTPVQPARRRLYDPETGQYVDVPVPQQPMAPMPVPMSPIAINPAGAYGHTYMIYPGFMPPPTMLPTLPPAPDPEYSDSGKGSIVARLHPEPQYLESSYNFSTGTVGQTTTSRLGKGLSEGKPIISITSQQGPRIIAPPSFDGTTMSFVVEHR